MRKGEPRSLTQLEDWSWLEYYVIERRREWLVDQVNRIGSFRLIYTPCIPITDMVEHRNGH